MAKLRKGVFWPSFCDSRQMIGEKIHLMNKNQLSLNLYKSMSTRKESICCSAQSGGIFNVEYNPDGCLLVAATENKNILIFSSSTHKLEKEIKSAHKSCVNLVKFLDSRLFATCSDDNTIAIWDLRNLSEKLKSLNGHKNWVKSIEYNRSEGFLLTSGYDHSVLKWDLNDFKNSPKQVLKIKNMLRMVLTPDCTKMIISTADGYLMIIHDLDLETLSDDLKDFVPDLYRLMQDSLHYGINMGDWSNPLFTAHRNRVELISDFPKKNSNGFITTLDVHPYGWAVLSRNTSGDELSEWTCVHDIQDSSRPLELEAIHRNFPTQSHFSETSLRGNNSHINNSDTTSSTSSQVIVVSNQIGSSQPNTTILSHPIGYQNIINSEFKVYKNIPRLRYFIEEPNENHGFIKEQCFSPDGRLICSPYQFGFRLLSYNSSCAEMCDCIEDKPKMLYELKKNLSHPGYVLTTKFSPTHCQIASGCLRGKVVFSQPIL